jgi:hypothetical protein
MFYTGWCRKYYKSFIIQNYYRTRAACTSSHNVTLIDCKIGYVIDKVMAWDTDRLSVCMSGSWYSVFVERLLFECPKKFPVTERNH